MAAKRYEKYKEAGRQARFDAESEREKDNPPSRYTKTEKAFWLIGWEEEHERLQRMASSGPRLGDCTLSLIRSGWRPQKNPPLPRMFA
jgi:hypothetical protein